MANFDKTELISILNQLRTEHTGAGRAKLAQGIGQLISDINSGKRDASEVNIKGRVRIAKFDGPRLPDSVPVEVQEFITDV